jgi:hypothetical protein
MRVCFDGGPKRVKRTEMYMLQKLYPFLEEVEEFTGFARTQAPGNVERVLWGASKLSERWTHERKQIGPSLRNLTAPVSEAKTAGALRLWLSSLHG